MFLFSRCSKTLLIKKQEDEKSVETHTMMIHTRFAHTDSHRQPLALGALTSSRSVWFLNRCQVKPPQLSRGYFLSLGSYWSGICGLSPMSAFLHSTGATRFSPYLSRKG